MTDIRAAELSDDRVLAEIDYLCWSPLTDPGPHWDRDWPFFGEPTQTRPDDVLVATLADVPIGFIKVSPEGSDFGDWYIGGLGVSPGARRRGVATQLVNDLRLARHVT